MSLIDKRLAELGIVLPTPAKPIANYVPWVKTGNLVYISGQGAVRDGKIEYTGKVGDTVSIDDQTHFMLLLKDRAGVRP